MKYKEERRMNFRLFNGAWIFFLIILFPFFYCDGIWPAIVDKSIDGFETYAVKVSIGVPEQTYKLQVSFAYDGIVIYKRLDFLSITYSSDYGGSDVLNIKGQRHRVPMILDPLEQMQIPGNPCKNCDGILGLSGASVVWKIWPNIGFSRGFLSLGKIHREFTMHDQSTLSAVQCYGIPIENYLCKTMGNMSIGHVNRETPIEFYLEDHNLHLPSYIYDSYMKGRNIYKDDIEKWPKINFRIQPPTTTDFETSIKEYKKMGINTNIEMDRGPREITFSLDPKNYVKPKINGARQLNIVRSEGSSVKIGTQVFREFMFNRNAFLNTMIVQAIHTEDYLAIENLVFIFIIVCLLVFWRITDLQQMSISKDEVNIRNTPVNIALEILGVIVSLATYVFPSSLEIVKDYVIVYVFAGIVFGIALYLKLVSVVTSPSLRKDLNLPVRRVSNRRFESRMIRSFSQEVLLLTAFWLLLSQRRIETLSTVLVLLVSIYLIYVSSFYSVMMIVYMFQLHVRGKELTTQLRISFSFAILIGLFQGLVTINFFYPPFLLPNSAAYVKLLIPGLLFLYLFIVTFAIYMVRLYINKWKTTLQYYKMFEKEEKGNRNGSGNGNGIGPERKKNIGMKHRKIVAIIK